MEKTDFFDRRPETVSARLELTSDVMRELSRANDPQAMYRVYTRRMAEIFPTSRQISLSQRGLHPPAVRITRFNLWTHSVNPWVDVERLPLLQGGLLSTLIHQGEAQVIDDLQIDRDDPSYEYLEGQRSLAAVPLYDGGEAINMVVLTREEPGAFTLNQMPELIWMSNLFGRATQAALLTQKLQANHEQIDHEVKQIARMQQSLLPKELPKISTLDIGAFSRTTSAAGGDYYDVIKLPRSRVGLLLADVCGHGVSAAMLVAVVHSLIKTYTGPPSPPGNLLSYVNDHLTRMYTRSFGTFVTAVYAIYDPDKATFSWANAGHPPLRLRRANGEQVVLKGSRCVPLGIVDGTEYQASEIHVRPGDQIMMHTDGLTDAKNARDEVFGTERLDAVLADASTAGARGMIRGVLESLETFMSGTPLADDCTLLAMKFVKSRKKAGELSGEWRALGSE
jgi:sigma-B regulation protein RsbU (phosphoserine phosphatase)